MKVCPKCKSKKITETLYGLIREPDEKLQKEIDDERIELGAVSYTHLTLPTILLV